MCSGIYRAQDNVIEDGSFDDGGHYFLFNPGRRYAGSTEDKARSDPTIGVLVAPAATTARSSSQLPSDSPTTGSLSPHTSTPA